MYRLICLPLVALCFLVFACQQQVKEVDAAQQTAVEVLDRYLEIFNTGNMALVDATIGETHFLVEPEFPDRIVGRQAFREWVNGYRTGYPDFNLTFINPNINWSRCLSMEHYCSIPSSPNLWTEIAAYILIKHSTS